MRGPRPDPLYNASPISPAQPPPYLGPSSDQPSRSTRSRAFHPLPLASMSSTHTYLGTLVATIIYMSVKPSLVWGTSAPPPSMPPPFWLLTNSNAAFISRAFRLRLARAIKSLLCVLLLYSSTRWSPRRRCECQALIGEKQLIVSRVAENK